MLTTCLTRLGCSKSHFSNHVFCWLKRSVCQGVQFLFWADMGSKYHFSDINRYGAIDYKVQRSDLRKKMLPKALYYLKVQLGTFTDNLVSYWPYTTASLNMKWSV